ARNTIRKIDGTCPNNRTSAGSGDWRAASASRQAIMMALPMKSFSVGQSIPGRDVGCAAANFTAGELGKLVMLHEKVFVDAVRKNALQFGAQSLAERPNRIAQSGRRIVDDSFRQTRHRDRRFAVLFFFTHHAHTALQQLAIDAALKRI